MSWRYPPGTTKGDIERMEGPEVVAKACPDCGHEEAEIVSGSSGSWGYHIVYCCCECGHEFEDENIEVPDGYYP